MNPDEPVIMTRDEEVYVVYNSWGTTKGKFVIPSIHFDLIDEIATLAYRVGRDDGELHAAEVHAFD